MADDDDEDRLAANEKVGRQNRLENAPPIGFGPNGEPNVTEKDAPPFEPEIAVPDDDVGSDVDDDLSDLDEIDELAEAADGDV